jgi:glycosyltransferase involved in cell wall biosynthesis
LPNWYRSADLVVLPSNSEGVPNVLVEAAACGIPFVATRVGGIPEIAHLSAGELVPPGDPAALAGAMEPWLRTESSAGSGLAAPVPSAAACAAATVNLFSDVLSGRNVNSSIPKFVNIPA